MTSLFVQVSMEQLYDTLLVTFLGALNIMTYHPVPVTLEEETFHHAHCSGPVRRGHEQQVRGEPEHLDVIKLDMKTLSDGGRLAFAAIWLSRNEASWRAVVIMSTKSDSGSHEMD